MQQQIHYFNNGGVSSKGNLLYSRPIGTWHFYDTMGNLSHTIDYDLQEAVYYYPRVVEFGSMIGGIREGLWKLIDRETGDLIESKYYYKGKIEL